MKPATLLVGLLLALPAVAHLASANVDQCSFAGFGSQPTNATGAPIVGTKAWLDGSCSGTGVVGAPGQCPALGQLCLGGVWPGAAVTCTWWTSLGSTAVALGVGIDQTADGNVYWAQDPFVALDRPLLPPTVATPSSFFFVAQSFGDVIVYPVGLTSVGSSSDVTVAACSW